MKAIIRDQEAGMTKTDAMNRAVRIARTREEWAYVVWSPEEQDIPGQHYHAASADAVDTVYGGADVVLGIGPDGTVETEA